MANVVDLALQNSTESLHESFCLNKEVHALAVKCLFPLGEMRLIA